MNDATNSNYALVEISSLDGRWLYTGSISRSEGFRYVISIADTKNKEVHAVSDVDDDSSKWSRYEDLPIDLRIHMDEEEFNGAVAEFYNAAREAWPIDKEDILKRFEEADKAGLVEEITIKPFQKLLKDNAFKLAENQKSFFKTFTYILSELLEIYGDENIIGAFEGFFFDVVDEEFMIDGKSIMPDISTNQFNKKMKKVLTKVTHDEIEFKMSPQGISKYFSSHDGYNMVEIEVDGEMVDQRIDEMVLVSFTGEKPENAIGVIHKDGNKTNDALDNLEWEYAE